MSEGGRLDRRGRNAHIFPRPNQLVDAAVGGNDEGKRNRLELCPRYGSHGKHATNVMIRFIGESIRFLGQLDVLRGLHCKQPKVLESVPTIITSSAALHVQVDGFWQPQLFLSAGELDRLVGNRDRK